jgi:CDP-diacylglycerol--serine O-phosphatidyltransferase
MRKVFPVLKYANIPNLVTTLGLVLGIVSCSFLFQNNLRLAIIFLFSATLMDVVDGFIAKKLKQQTSFGQYLDLLVDFFVCAAIPVMMLFIYTEVSVLIIAASAFYGVCGLWRLAYFISVTAEENRPYFTGLPVPAALPLVVASVWLSVQYGLPAWSSVAAFFITGVLMISSIRFRKYGICQKTLAAVWLAFLIIVIIS